jgi:hypothetical protein
MNETVGTNLDRVQRIALIVGVVAAVLLAVGAFLSRAQFFQSYLFAFLFWMQLTLGCLGVMMLHHLTGGRWGFGIRRLLEAGALTLPLMALLFLPLILGLADLYPWARQAEVAGNALLRYKNRTYLNVPFFLGRTVVYFAVWGVFAFILRRWSLRQDRSGEAFLTRRMRLLSRGGLVAFVLAVTFASIDWAMSIEPLWISTIYGAVYLAGEGLTALAFVTLVLTLLDDRTVLPEIVTVDRFNDLGNLILAFVILSMYMSFSQFLIIWSGNIPEEVTWYVHRFAGGWNLVAVALVILHFALPLFMLLSRDLKRTPRMLARLAIMLLLAHLLAIFWFVAPTFHPEGIHLSWMDIVAPIAIGGLWIAFFIWQLKGKALLPRRDPRMQESFSHAH